MKLALLGTRQGGCAGTPGRCCSVSGCLGPGIVHMELRRVYIWAVHLPASIIKRFNVRRCATHGSSPTELLCLDGEDNGELGGSRLRINLEAPAAILAGLHLKAGQRNGPIVRGDSLLLFFEIASTGKGSRLASKSVSVRCEYIGADGRCLYNATLEVRLLRKSADKKHVYGLKRNDCLSVTPVLYIPIKEENVTEVPHSLDFLLNEEWQELQGSHPYDGFLSRVLRELPLPGPDNWEPSSDSSFSETLSLA